MQTNSTSITLSKVSYTFSNGTKKVFWELTLTFPKAGFIAWLAEVDAGKLHV